MQGKYRILYNFANLLVCSHDKLPFYIKDYFFGNLSLFEPDAKYSKYFITNKIKEKIEIEAVPLDIYSEELEFINIVRINVEVQSIKPYPE